MKLVRFRNGQYGVRRFSLIPWYTYGDLQHPEFWWEKHDKYFRCCVGTKEEAEERLRISTDYGTPVKR